MGFSAKIKIDSKRPRQDGTAAIFLQIIIDRRKSVIALEIAWPVNKFSARDWCRARWKDDRDVEEYNIIITNALTKANEIHKQYLVRGQHYTLDSFLKDYRTNLNKDNFIEYIDQRSNTRWSKGVIVYETRKKEKAVIAKLKEFCDVLPFYEFHTGWALEFDNFLRKKYNNSQNTRWSAHKIIKTYLNIAEDQDKIVFTDPYKKFSAKLGESSWGPLSLDEHKSLIDLYYSDKLNGPERIVLRRFLFSCNSALRIGDLVKNLHRSTFKDGKMTIEPLKTERHGTKIREVPLNDIALEMLKDEKADKVGDQLFDRYTGQAGNKLLKDLAKKTEPALVKNLHNHVARYTFASLMDQAGANHTALMSYMGLKKRETLAKYVKTNRQVIQEGIDKMNDLVKLH